MLAQNVVLWRHVGNIFYLCSFFPANMERENATLVYILCFFRPVLYFHSDLIADWCRTGITRGPGRTQQPSLLTAAFSCLVFELMGKELVQPVWAPSSVPMSASIYGE